LRLLHGFEYVVTWAEGRLMCSSSTGPMFDSRRRPVSTCCQGVARVTVFAGVVEWQTHRLVLVALAFDAFLKPSEPRGSDCSGLGVHRSRLAQDT
jgi:hypothetical protein